MQDLATSIPQDRYL